MPPINRLMRRLRQHTSVARIFRTELPEAAYRRPQTLQPARITTTHEPSPQKVAAVLPGERLSALPSGFLVNRPVPARDYGPPPLDEQMPLPDESVEEPHIVRPAAVSSGPQEVQRAPAVSAESKAPSSDLEKDWPRLRNILQRHQDTVVQQEEKKQEEAGDSRTDTGEQTDVRAEAAPPPSQQQVLARDVETKEPPSKPTRVETPLRKPAVTEIEPVAKAPLPTSDIVQPSVGPPTPEERDAETAQKTAADSGKAEREPGEALDQVLAAAPAEEKASPQKPIATVEPAEDATLQRKAAEPPTAPAETPAYQGEIAAQGPTGTDFSDMDTEETSAPPHDDLIQQSAAETQVIRPHTPDLLAAAERDAGKEQYPQQEKSLQRELPSTREMSEKEALPGEEIPPEETVQTRQTVPLEAAWPVEEHPRPQPERVETPAAREVRASQEAEESMEDHPADEAPLHQVLERIAVQQPTESKVEIITTRHPRPAAPPIQRQAEPETAQPSPEAGEEIIEEREDASSGVPLPASDTPQGAPSAVHKTLEPEQVQTDIGPLPADLWKLIGQEIPAQEQLIRGESETPTRKQPQSTVQPALQAEREEQEQVPPSVQDFPRSVRAEPPVIIQRVTEQTETQTAEQPSTSSTQAEPTEAPEVAQQEQQEEKINVEELARKVYEAIRHRLMTALSIERERMRRNP
jgi:hypothetical protein